MTGTPWHPKKSVMTKDFSKAPSADVQRSKFNRSHGLKTTFDSGLLIPILVDEVYPGDSVTLSLTALARLATPIHPTMDNMTLSTFFFFVPNRLVWENWQRFMGEQDSPGDSVDFTIPTLQDGQTLPEGSIYDYMGLPTQNNGVNGINVLPMRAYNLIFRDWFRDENLVDSPNILKDDGPDALSNYALLSRGKRHDYFTSCLPWPAKDFGNPVELPLGSSAPVVGTGNLIPAFNVQDGSGVTQPLRSQADNTVTMLNNDATLGSIEWGDTMLEADLSTATAATINDLRQAFQIQKLQERDARGGTRYTEIIKAHFKVTSPDSRLQRPEYLGGGQTAVGIQPIAQTTDALDVAGGDTPQGNLAGVGTATVQGHGFSKGFVEHGFIIGLMSVQADLTYQQGLPRQWSRSTKYDYYFPVFQALGEQAVLNKEIFAQGTAGGADDNNVFGYQERWAELRYKQSQITGEFRSNAAATLDSWHLSQDFDTLPVLNENFITDKPPIDRIIAVPDEPQFIMDAYFNYTWARPMPLYSVPGYIDHF